MIVPEPVTSLFASMIPKARRSFCQWVEDEFVLPDLSSKDRCILLLNVRNILGTTRRTDRNQIQKAKICVISWICIGDGRDYV